MGKRVEHRVRVIYGDTDKMGIVYYANYLRFFEGARAAWLREQGRSYAEIEEGGLALPVAEAHASYRAPARYDEELVVEVGVGEVRNASFRFEYRVRRDATLLCEGYTVHACTDLAGRPRRMPDELRRMLAP
jgi:acyl-CoA thioester hydrolase